MADNHMKGTVRWFSARRGYGFLSDENGVDYFVHYSEITGDGFKKLSAGEPVEFMAGEDGQGRTIAREVTALNRIEQGMPEDTVEETAENVTEDTTEENNI